MTNLQGASREIVQRERLSEGDYMYCLYWIRLEDHTDIHSQGYVGITHNQEERMRAHSKSKKKNHFFYAKEKYGWDNLTKEVIIDNLPLEDALFLEGLYRPTQNIGWNSQQGGHIGVESSWYSVQENADKHRKATSSATKLGILEKDSKAARSYRAKESWQRTKETRKDTCLGEKNPRAILTESQVREIKYNLIPQGLSNIEISDQFNVKPYVISYIRRNVTWKHV
jgi:hypothetical protein